MGVHFRFERLSSETRTGTWTMQVLSSWAVLPFLEDLVDGSDGRVLMPFILMCAQRRHRRPVGTLAVLQQVEGG